MKDVLLNQSIEFRPPQRKDLLRYKTAKRTLDALLDYVDSFGETFVGIKTLANRLLVSNQTIINHFEILQDLGILEIEKIGNKAYKKVQFLGSKDSSTQGSKDSSKDSSTQGSTQGSNSVESKEGTELKELKGAAILSSPFGEDVISVGDYLRHRILTEQPTARIPENLNGWYGDIDKAIRLDKRTKDDLISCIDWIYTSDGSFWRPNIRSGKKLRDKFDQMSGQAKDKATRRKK